MSASAVCPSCGTLNLPANLFCTNCGVRLVPAAAVTASPATSPQATPPGIPPTAPSGFPAAGGAYPYFPPPPQRANAPNILSGMFDVWAKNFLNFLVVFLSLAFLNALIAALLAFAILGTFVSGSGVLPAPAGFTGSSLGALLVLSAGTFVSAVILNSAVIGGMTEYAVRRYRGEAVPLERALRRGFDRFLSILGGNFLLTMLTFGLIILPLLLILYGTFLVGGSANPGSAIGLLCGGLAALAVGGLVALYLSIALSLYAPAIMMENKRAVDGLMRSWQITKGYRWSLFGAIFVAGILALVITLAITLPTALVFGPIANLVAGAIASGLVGSLSVILAGVAYDLIVRQRTFGARPYFPGSTISPPAGAMQTPRPPPGQSPPPGP